MKEFKGTQGKWEYHIIGFNASAYHCIKSEDGKTICLIYPKEHLSSEVECNAQLIANAPELLEALQEINKDLSILEGSMAQIEIVDKRAEGMTNLVKEWRARNKKAINKALGL